jgi:hypothetical protein
MEVGGGADRHPTAKKLTLERRRRASDPRDSRLTFVLGDIVDGMAVRLVERGVGCDRNARFHAFLVGLGNRVDGPARRPHELQWRLSVISVTRESARSRLSHHRKIRRS